MHLWCCTERCNWISFRLLGFIHNSTRNINLLVVCNIKICIRVSSFPPIIHVECYSTSLNAIVASWKITEVWHIWLIVLENLLQYNFANSEPNSVLLSFCGQHFCENCPVTNVFICWNATICSRLTTRN